MSTSDYLEDAILNHILSATGYASPNATLHLALFVADPTDANITANEVETTVLDTAYARQPISFAAASGGTSASSNAQTFAAVIYGSGAADYNVTHFAIYDALTVGNLLYHNALSAPINRQASKALLFDTGNISVTQD